MVFTCKPREEKGPIIINETTNPAAFWTTHAMAML